MNRLQMIVNSFTPIMRKTLTSTSWDVIYNRQTENENSVLANPYSKVGIVYVCISTTADAIGQVPILIMKRVGAPSQGMRRRQFLEVNKNWFIARRTGKFDKPFAIERKSNGDLVQWEPVQDTHPWQKLFDRPNYLCSQPAWTEAIVSYYMLHGNVWNIGLPASNRIIPDSMWVAKRDTVKPKKDKNGHLLAWEYHPQGTNIIGANNETGKITIDIDERICHIKQFNPDDPIMGMAPLETAAKSPIKSDFKMSRYNEKILDNDGQPAGAVMTDKYMSMPQCTEFRQEWREKHGGADNAGNLAILHSGLKYQTIGFDLSSLQHLDLRKFSRDEIIQILKMNKAVISITEDLNRSISDSQIKSWWQKGNIPMINRIENAISYQFMKNDPNLRIMYDLSTVNALQEDFKEKTEIAKVYWGMGISFDAINERLELGFDSDMPGCNTGYLPLSLMPVGDDFNMPPEPETTPPEELPPPEEEQRLITAPQQKITVVPYIDIIAEEDKKFKAWEQKAEGLWKRVVNQVDKIEKPFEGKVKKVFFELRKNLLSVLHTGKPSKVKAQIIEKRLTEEAIRDINEYTCMTERALLDRYAQGYFDISITQGIDTIMSELGEGQRLPVTDPLVQAYILAKRTKITSVIDTVKKQIERQMHLAATEGEDIPHLEKRIKQTLGIADRRAHMIARTEMGGSLNFGRYAQIMQTSFKNKIWFTALDERVRGNDEHDEFDHVAMHGQKLQIGPNTAWDVPSKSGRNGRLLYPGDYTGDPANIINDRCIEVVDTEEI